MSDGIETTVSGALIVEVTTKLVKDGTMTLWQVKTADNTVWTTNRADLGNAAKQLEGQKADMKVKIQQNGQYTNYYLNKIRPAEAQTEAGEAAVKAAAAQEARQEMNYEQYRSGEDEKEKRKNESIHRQVATKVAVQLPTVDMNEFWSNVNVLLNFYRTGNIPGQQTIIVSPTETSVTSHTPPTDDFESTDDDIPF